MTKSDDTEIRILAPTGVCGSGFFEASFELGLAKEPHFIGCDGGSTDPGPSHLGCGEPAFPRDAVKRDLRLMLIGARRLKIPLLVGSVGHRGRRRASRADAPTPRRRSLQMRACAFKLALIHAEQQTGLPEEAAARRAHPAAVIRRPSSTTP